MADLPQSALFMLFWSCRFFFAVRLIFRRNGNVVETKLGQRLHGQHPEWLRRLRFDLKGRWQYDVIGLIAVMVVFNVWVVPHILDAAKQLPRCLRGDANCG